MIQETVSNILPNNVSILISAKEKKEGTRTLLFDKLYVKLIKEQCACGFLLFFSFYSTVTIHLQKKMAQTCECLLIFE